MASDLPKIAILLNGPPRCGKDTAVDALRSSFGVEGQVFKFTSPVKDMTHKNAGLDCQHDFFEELKDTPLDVFGGRTPRQAYIDTSADLKARYGIDAVAKLFVEAITASDASVILNPDVGDDMETECVADALSADCVLVIRIHREGRDFSKDCRTWVNTDRVKIVDVKNVDGRRREYESEVVAWAQKFVSDARQRVERAYAA